jgi:hypothetical protein
MKKLLSILCVSIIALTAASCKKETIVQGGNTNRTVYRTNVSNWQLTNSGTSYFVDLNIPELDDTYNENGAVLVYVAAPGSSTWEQIPEVYDGLSFSFTHDVGIVSITSQNPSGTGAPIKPNTVDIKIVMIDSNID